MKEGQVVGNVLLPTDENTPEAIHPGVCSFTNPTTRPIARHTQRLLLLATALDVPGVAPEADHRADIIIVVALVGTKVLLGIGAMSVFLGNLLTIVAREWSFWLMICGGLTFVVTSGALIVLSIVRPTWKKIGLAGCVLGLGLLAMLFSVGVSGLAGARLNLRVNRNAMEEVVRRSWAGMERADSAVRLDSGAPLDTRLEVTDGYVAFVQGGMLDHLYGTIYFRDQPLPYGSPFLGRSIGQVERIEGPWYYFVTH